MFDNLNASVAAELRAAVARKNIPRSHVAEELDVPVWWVHRRLAGDVEISVGDLVRLSYAIGVEPLDVLAQVIRDSDLAAAGT